MNKNSELNYLNEVLDKFIDNLSSDFPSDFTTLNFHYFLGNIIEHLKIEVVENLVSLNQEAKKHYLQSVKMKVKMTFSSFIPDLLYDVNRYCKKYNILIDNVFMPNFDNALSLLLLSDTISPRKQYFDNDDSNEFPDDDDNILHVFQEYSKKLNCDVLFGFIDEQLTELTPKEAKKEKEVIVEPMKTDYQIRNEHLIYMLNYLEYTYPYQYCPCSFFYQLKDSIPYLKTEVYNNLVTLSEAGKTPYLNNIKYQLGRKYEEIDPNTLEYVEKYKNEYNVQDYDMYNFGYQNGLLKVLSEEPKELEKRFLKPHLYDDELPKEADSMQLVFWHYAIKVHCETVFDFVDEQLNLLAPNTKTETKPTITKVDTNLTVPQLAYLFRALVDEDLITPKQKTDLFKAVSEIFKTKGTETISSSSFKNHFNSPESNAIDFWQGKFTHLMQRAKKDKSKEN